MMQQQQQEEEKDGSAVVKRFLNRTFDSIAKQKRENARVLQSQDTGSVDVGDGNGDGDDMKEEKSEHQHYKASLLGIPVELRQSILSMVIGSHAFLSSTQQLSAECSACAKAAKRESDTSSTTTTTMNDENTSTGHGGRQLRPYELKPKRKPSPFTHNAMSFKVYASSRRADTALLYTCRQLRHEALRLWYNTNYYLSLIVEQGRHDLNNRACPVVNGGRFRQDVRRSTLWFDEHDQQAFWSQIARTLRFPSLDQMGCFNKFHVSLFVENSAFEDIDRTTGVTGAALPSCKILHILLGGGGGQGANSTTRTGRQSVTSNLDVIREDDEESDGEMQALEEQEEEEVRYGEVKFSDHTYLGLACDAVDDANPGSNMQPDSVDEEQSQGKSFSVSMWKVG